MAQIKQETVNFFRNGLRDPNNDYTALLDQFSQSGIDDPDFVAQAGKAMKAGLSHKDIVSGAMNPPAHVQVVPERPKDGFKLPLENPYGKGDPSEEDWGGLKGPITSPNTFLPEVVKTAGPFIAGMTGAGLFTKALPKIGGPALLQWLAANPQKAEAFKAVISALGYAGGEGLENVRQGMPATEALEQGAKSTMWGTVGPLTRLGAVNAPGAKNLPLLLKGLLGAGTEGVTTGLVSAAYGGSAGENIAGGIMGALSGGAAEYGKGYTNQAPEAIREKVWRLLPGASPEVFNVGGDAIPLSKTSAGGPIIQAERDRVTAELQKALQEYTGMGPAREIGAPQNVATAEKVKMGAKALGAEEQLAQNKLLDLPGATPEEILAAQLESKTLAPSFSGLGKKTIEISRKAQKKIQKVANNKWKAYEGAILEALPEEPANLDSVKVMLAKVKPDFDLVDKFVSQNGPVKKLLNKLDREAYPLPLPSKEVDPRIQALRESAGVPPVPQEFPKPLNQKEVFKAILEVHSKGTEYAGKPESVAFARAEQAMRSALPDEVQPAIDEMIKDYAVSMTKKGEVKKGIGAKPYGKMEAENVGVRAVKALETPGSKMAPALSEIGLLPEAQRVAQQAKIAGAPLDIPNVTALGEAQGQVKEALDLLSQKQGLLKPEAARTVAKMAAKNFRDQAMVNGVFSPEAYHEGIKKYPALVKIIGDEMDGLKTVLEKYPSSQAHMDIIKNKLNIINEMFSGNAEGAADSFYQSLRNTPDVWAMLERIGEKQPGLVAETRKTLVDGLFNVTPRDGSFDLSKMVARYDKLPTTAKEFIFGKEKAKLMDEIVTLSDTFNEVERRIAQPGSEQSGSQAGRTAMSIARYVTVAGGISGATALAGLPGGLVAGGLAGVIYAHPYVAARLLMSNNPQNISLVKTAISQGTRAIGKAVSEDTNERK